MEQLDRAHSEYNLERLVTLTDGVFAIAMTLLALELRPPAQWDGALGALWVAMRGSLLAYGISFLVLGGYWISHRRSFALFLRADGPLTALCLVALAMATLLPVATRLLIEHPRAPGALIVYLGLIAALGAVNALIWGYAAVAEHVMDPRVTARFRIAHFVLLVASPLIACVICFLALGGAGLSYWLIVAALGVALSLGRRLSGHALGVSPPAKAPPAPKRPRRVSGTGARSARKPT